MNQSEAPSGTQSAGSTQRNAPGPGTPAGPLGWRSKVLLALACAFLVDASGLFTASSAQLPSADDPIAQVNCMGEQTATAIDRTVEEVKELDVSGADLNTTGVAEEAPRAVAHHCCNLTISSQTGGTTRWSDADGPGATGYNLLPVDVGYDSFTNARRLWKQSSAVPDGDPTNPGTVFKTVFVNCRCSCNTGTLLVASDDQQRVHFNDGPVLVPNPNSNVCNAGWGNKGVCYATYTINGIKPYPHDNTFRFHVKNWAGAPNDPAGPAWVAYRFTW